MRRFMQCALGACVIAATIVLSVAGVAIHHQKPAAASVEPAPGPPAAIQADSPSTGSFSAADRALANPANPEGDGLCVAATEDAPAVGS